MRRNSLAGRSRNAVSVSLLASVALLAGCSGAGESGGDSTVESQPASTTVAPGTPATTQPATTNTEPPAPVPLGARWQEAAPLLTGVKGLMDQQFVTVGDELWLLVDTLDYTHTLVSHDGGVTFAEVVIAPVQEGSIRISGIIRTDSGGYLAYGSRGLECFAQSQLTDGYEGFQVCTRSRGVVWLSADGTSWEQVEPGGLVAPGDAVFQLVDIVATPSGFVAAANIKSLDWHGALFTSPDGRSWTLAREMRGEGTGAMSLRAIVHDGSQLAVLGGEHSCARLQRANNSYQPDVAWVSLPRLYLGATPGDLALVPNDQLPFADGPTNPDCAATDSFDLAQQPRTELAMNLIGGVLTLTGVFNPGTTVEYSDEQLATGGVRQVAQWKGGAWDETVVEGMPILDDGSGWSQVVPAEGGVAIVENRGWRAYELESAVVAPSDGTPTPVGPEHPFLADELDAAAGAPGRLLIAGNRMSAGGVASTFTFQIPRDILVWTSEATSGPPPDTCELAPGGSCRFADLTTVDGYPNFTGMDLTGIDLAAANLGEADFTGATLTGATLWVASGDGATFDGADLSGAQAQRARLGSSVGTNFSGANLTDAVLDDASGAVLVGAVLNEARVTLKEPTDLTGAYTAGASLDLNSNYEWSLTGLDLSDTYIGPEFSADGLLRITDLSGSNVEWASFSDVDLTGANVAGVDLSKTAFNDASRCPSGQPPNPDVYSGGCA